MRYQVVLSLFLPVVSAALWGLGGSGEAPEEVPVTQRTLEKEVVAGGLSHPWGLAFLPDGGMLVTERPGRVRRVELDCRLLPPVMGVLAVALDPDFSRNNLLYLSFSEPAGTGANRTAVARAKLAGGALEEVKVIF